MSQIAVVNSGDFLEPTLNNILDQESLKWVFVGGKGGVGKTTTSCSLGVLLASRRRSVLIVSTDPAHNLSDAFGQKFSGKPTLVNGFDNLSCLEIEPSQALAEGMVPTDDAAAAGGGAEQGISQLMKELGTTIPGIDEALSFAEIMKSVDSLDYQVVVFDTAPTGHTLRLLSFPRALETAFQKLNTVKDKMMGLVGRFAPMLGMQEGGMELMLAKLEDTRKIVERVNLQFQNPEMTTFVCVCIPEFLSLYETERLVQELTKFGIDTHNIVVNSVLFAEPDACRKLLARKRMQDKYLDQIQDLYGEDFHVVVMPVMDEEVRGPVLLKKFAQNLIHPYIPPNRVEGVPSSSAVVPKIVEKYGLNAKEVYAYLDSIGLPVPKPSGT
jgi:arsenite-transporting ATPase